MTLHDYRHWLGVARGFARVADEAEDLLQDALLVAAQQQRLDFTMEDHRRWLTGVLRNLAAQTARMNARRRRREDTTATSPSHRESDPSPGAGLPKWLDTLPSAPRRVLVLALHGLQPSEIQILLGLTATAYRQRLTSLRKHLGALPEDLHCEVLALSSSRRHARGVALDLGLMRRALLRRLHADTGERIGTHDPDGHLIVLSTSENYSPPVLTDPALPAT